MVKKLSQIFKGLPCEYGKNYASRQLKNVSIFKTRESN